MGGRTLAAFTAALILIGSPSAAAGIRFEDVTVAAGVLAGSSGLASGSAWRDFDGDGWPDLFVGNHFAMPILFRNGRDGTFTNVTLTTMTKPNNVRKGVWGDQHGSAWADFDNDGDHDLIVLVGSVEGTAEGQKQLYVSTEGRLVDHAVDLGIDYPLARGRSPTWLDYDNDGRLDVFVGAVPRPDRLAPPTLFRQTETGFVDVRAETGFKPIDTLGIWIADLDRDGRMDILFRGKSEGPTPIRGSRINVIKTTEEPFRDVTPIAFRALFPDLAIADFDGDLRPDLFIANNWGASATPYGHDLYLNRVSGWVRATTAAQINQISRPSRPGAIAADFDNDMDVDVFLDCGIANGSDLVNIMLWNNGNGTFVAEDGAAGAGGRLVGQPDSVTAADYNLDGFVDLYITYSRTPVTQLLRNLGNTNSWLEIDLRGTRSNRDAIGAQVYVSAGGKTQLREQSGGFHRYWGQNDQRLHFGLGTNTTASRIVVDWPSGARSELVDVAANQVLTIIEPE
jgi:hypothetical protein